MWYIIQVYNEVYTVIHHKSLTGSRVTRTRCFAFTKLGAKFM